MSRSNLVPKIVGGDYELGNTLIGGVVGRSSRAVRESSADAARLLLAEIPGGVRRREIARDSNAASRRGPIGGDLGTQDEDAAWQQDDGGENYRDWGRKYQASNGGCCYIDSGHLEVCVPEVRSAIEHEAAVRAMFAVALAAMRRANQRLPEGSRIVVTANNSDGHGASFGSHLNVAQHRDALYRLIYTKPQPLLFLASHQVSSIVWAGAGKVGGENSDAPANFVLSQRGCHMESLLAPQTTYRRPLVNTRNEPLAGGDMSRLHCIFYDCNLLSAPAILKVGALQIVAALLELDDLPPELMLADPLEALRAWNGDLNFAVSRPTVTGQLLTPVELQRRFYEHAAMRARNGDFEDAVPGLEGILTLWDETLSMLERRDWNALTRRLDWALKLSFISRALERDDSLDWSSDEILYLDQIYASIDPCEGLAYLAEAAGTADCLGDAEATRRFSQEPPADTRAWFRAELLRRFSDDVQEVDWDRIRFSSSHGRSFVMNLSDPGGPLRATAAALLEGCRTAADLERRLNAIERPSPKTRQEVLN